MSKNWTRLASTLLLVALAMPAGATEYGAWKLIDTKTVQEFSPDASAPTDPFGKWELVDVAYSKVFLGDVANPFVSKYGQWELANVSFDRRWMGDQFIRKDDLGSSEVGRSLASDEVEKDKYLKETGARVFGAATEKLLNPVKTEVTLGQYKRRDSGRPVSTLVEKYRIDTTYDKEVSHPWTMTHTYAERAKHTRIYDVTLDKKWKLVFKDPIKGSEIAEYVIATSKHQDVSATGFADNGVLTTVKESGIVVDPLVKVTKAGSVQERELGKTAESAAGAASAKAASAAAYSSNSQSGNNLKRIGYAGEEERKALGIDKIVLSQKQSKKAALEAAMEAKLAAEKPVPLPTPKPAAGLNNRDAGQNNAYRAPVVSQKVKEQLGELDGTRDWKDLGEAIHAAKTKDDLIAIGLALLAGKGGDIKSSEPGMSEAQIRERVAKLKDESDSSKAQFVADMLDVQKDTLTGRWAVNLTKFFGGREVPGDSRMRFFQEMGMEPVISRDSGFNLWGTRTVVYTLKLGNVELGPYTTTYDAW